MSEWESLPGDPSGQTQTTDENISSDCDIRADAEKRESLVQLRERYVEAQKLVSRDKPYANLEWILGARRSITKDPLGMTTSTIELVGLWLQDLAAELDRRLPPSSGDPDNAALSPDAVRELIVQSLRDATERFLLAFRSRPEMGAEREVAVLVSVPRTAQSGPARRWVG